MKRARVMPQPWRGQSGTVYTFEPARPETENVAASYGVVAALSRDPRGWGRRHAWGKSLVRLIADDGGKLIELIRAAECAAGHHVRGRCKVECRP